MPIEIKITDIESLTLSQIDDLHMYLFNTITQRKEVGADKIVDPHSSHEDASIYEITKGLVEALGGKVADDHTPIDNLPEVPAPVKQRKKRKATEDLKHLASEEPKYNTLPGKYYSAGETVRVEDAGSFKTTHADLIEFVLENTREKRLQFSDVMKIIAQYDLINLSALDTRPELIEPIYTAIKGLLV